MENSMYISYDYYRIFYYVAKYGSFTQAAEKMLANQPNLTRAMKTLEAELGCTLFVRSNKGVKLPPEGEKLYAHICLAFEHIQAGEEEISLNKSFQKGVVSIGATEIALRCFLLPILNEFRTKYPGIRIKISNVSTPQALTLVKNGLVDFAIVTTPMEKNAEMRIAAVKNFSEVAVCGSAYKERICQEAVSLKKLTEFPIISLEKGCGTYGFYAELFEKNGAAFTPDIEASTADQILPMVKHNLGVGFVPEEILRAETSRVWQVNLLEDIPKRNICVVSKKSASLSLPAKELERMMSKDIKESCANSVE